MKFRKTLIFIFLVGLILPSCEDLLDNLTDDPRDSFVGQWKVSEDETKKSISYEVNITKSDSDSTLIFIKNFYELGTNVSVRGIVDGYNLSIPEQTVSGFVFKGYGSVSLNEKTINMAYTADYQNGSKYSVVDVYTRMD